MKETPKIDTTHPVPIPTEWNNGSIQMATPPAKPLRGRNHERVRLLGKSCPATEKAARKWFCEKLYEEEGEWSSEHAGRVTEGSSTNLFLSTEAYQLWNEHKAFWMQEYEAAVTRHRTTEQAIARKHNESLKRAAAKASITATELKGKMQRLKKLLQNDDGRPLALELIKAADPWLLEALLVGATLRKEWRDEIFLDLELNVGEFFEHAYGSFGVPFWLTVARARAAGCCPHAFNVSDLYYISMAPKDVADMDIITGEILPFLPELQQLTLELGSVIEAQEQACEEQGTFTFSTASLPAMPVMNRLIIDTDCQESGCSIMIESLEKQVKLEVVMLQGALSLKVLADQELLFGQIRLESPSHVTNQDSLADISRPPKFLYSVKDLNVPAARVLVRMQSDHSVNPTPPHWWRSAWAKPESGAQSDTDEFADDDARCLDLGQLAFITAEIADVFASSGIPVIIPRYLLSTDILKKFRNFKSDLHITMVPGLSSDFVQELIGISVSTLTIAVEGDLSADTASALALFAGTRLKLIFAQGTLNEKVIDALSRFSGNLILKVADYQDSEFSKKSAEKLIRKNGGLQIEGRWQLDAETLDVLSQRSDFDLGEYRLRHYEKRNGKQVKFCKVQLFYTRSSKGYLAHSTKGKIGEAGQTKTVFQQEQSMWALEKFLAELIEQGFKEIIDGDITAEIPCEPLSELSVKSKTAAKKKDRSKPSLLIPENWDSRMDLSGWWLSEKFKGVRAYWDGRQLVSQLGNTYPAPVWFTQNLPATPLDGELWVGHQQFEKTVSIVRGQDHSDCWKAVSYLVFDAPTVEGGFEERMDTLRGLLVGVSAGHVRIVEQHPCLGVDHLREELARIVALGGEGIMARKPGSVYEVGLSATLLKVKQFQEAEAIVIRHEVGKGTHKGRLGSLRVKLPHGIEFSVGTGLSDRERENPPALGSVITFQYQELSDAGVPRFPSFLRVRSDGEIQRVDPGKELVSSPQKPTKSSPLTPASKTGSTPKTERYFEYKDNKSSKFWEICMQGSDVTVRFGKIGGTGQTQSKSFNDPALAYAHAEKLIMAKAKKGYHEMSDENLSAGKERPNRKSGAFEPQMAPAQEHEPARVSELGKNKSH